MAKILQALFGILWLLFVIPIIYYMWQNDFIVGMANEIPDTVMWIIFWIGSIGMIFTIGFLIPIIMIISAFKEDDEG